VGQAGSLTAHPWRPSALIRASAYFHVAVVAAFAIRPAWWPLCLAAIIVNHVLLGLIGMWPRSRLLGPNMVRLPEMAMRRNEVSLTFDDGPDPRVTPAVLDLLDRFQAKASFFCVGEKAAAHPDLLREIARRGHSIENHSMRHSGFFGFFGPKALHADIEAAQVAIVATTGRLPAFFRSPMGIRNPFLDPVVAQLGLTYISWTRRGFDTVARDPAAILARLTRGLAAGDVLLLHDRPGAAANPPVLDVLPALLERIAAAGLKPVSLPMAMR